MSDILAKTPKDADQVTIEPNGKWSQPSETRVSPKHSGDRTSSGDDDDLVEIKDMPRIAAVKSESMHLPGFAARTPPSSSREQSAASTTAPAGSGKRTAQVIEISSDEDEDEPPRAPKRQATQSTLNGLPTYPKSNHPAPYMSRTYANPL